MAQNQDVITALQNKIYAVLSGNQALPAGSFVSLVNGGLAMTGDDLKFLSDSTDTQGLLNFTDLVDRIPAGVGPWSATSELVQKVYGDWLNAGIVLPEISLTPTEQAELKQAQSTVTAYYATYSSYRNLYQSAINTVTGLELEKNRPDNYTVLLRQAQEAADNALDDWTNLGHKDDVEQARGVVGDYQSRGFAGLLGTLRRTYEDQSVVSSGSTGQRFAPVTALPADFASSDARWNEFTFSSADVSTYTHNSTVSTGGDASYMEDLFWVSGGLSYSDSRTYQETDTSNLGVRFEYCRVALDRTSWFDDFLLTSRSWTWPGATPAKPDGDGTRLSDGGRPPTGLMPLLPQEVLFTRNLEITMDTSRKTNQTTLEKMSAGVSAGFFIFRIGGAGVSQQDSSSKYTFTRTDTGISAPQMQISAFICQTLPKLPDPDFPIPG